MIQRNKVILFSSYTLSILTEDGEYCVPSSDRFGTEKPLNFTANVGSGGESAVTTNVAVAPACKVAGPVISVTPELIVSYMPFTINHCCHGDPRILLCIKENNGAESVIWSI